MERYLVGMFERSVKAGALEYEIVRMFHRMLRFHVLPETARGNVAHHYDLDERLFRLFLDPDMQYSCAYYEYGNETLEEAQRKKKRHIAAKMWLAPGQRVLDIGCGWGGMGLYLAQVAGAEVTGVTLAEEQLRVARQRAEAAGLADRVGFLLMDYRKVEGTFDRVVSVGMFEHVGPQQEDRQRFGLGRTGTVAHHAARRATAPDPQIPCRRTARRVGATPAGARHHVRFAGRAER